MNREEIMRIIPHRDTMLLIDEAYLKDGTAHGKSKIDPDAWFLRGHFPGNPIVPGVILCEMAAQTCCVLFSDKISGKAPLFTSLNNVRFRAQVKPGDTVSFECSSVNERPPFYFAKGKGYVNGKLCMSGEFSFAAIGE